MISGRPQPNHSASRLIAELEDGVIGHADRARLMDLLRTDESVRALYLQHSRLTALIHQVAESRAELGTMPVSQETLHREKRRSALLSLSYAAAAMLVLGLGLLLYQVSRQPPVDSPISLRGSADAAYAVVRDEQATATGDKLRPGDQITVSRGLLRLDFPSGVEALVEGPVQLELISHSTLRMDGGMGWFRVPEKARGFTVRTDHGQVVDLGTEFGIRFDPRGDLEVHVASGRVKVLPSPPGAEVRELTAAEAMRFDDAGRHHPLDIRTSLFRRHFSEKPPHIHWSFDRLVDGAFPASGTFPGVEDAALHPRRLDGTPATAADLLTDGVFEKALSLDGDGHFVGSAFSGIAGDAPFTLAAWVRYRGGIPESRADPRTGLGATTPFGHQAYLLNYTNASLTTTQGATGQTLAADVTYTLDFHVAARPEQGSAEYRVELVAFDPSEDDDARRTHQHGVHPGTVVAETRGLVETSDLSARDRIRFTARADDPNLGQDLGIRLVKSSGSVFYDHLRLTARRAADEETVVFTENFESPAVAGYAEGVLPSRGWIGAVHGPGSAMNPFGSARHGLFSQRPVFSAPLVAWGDSASLRAAFMISGKNPGWSLADGRVFHDAASPLLRDRWFHLATVHTGRRDDQGEPEIRHYLDGRLLPAATFETATAPPLPFAADALTRLTLGALPHADPAAPTLDADIDELHLLRAALGEKEIWKLMDDNRPVFRND